MADSGAPPHSSPPLAEHLNPFKGQDSYQVEDAGLFFGRDREADELTATILAHPVTILNAGSGVGKTSLLNARIIPRLEAHRWVPVRLRPGDHPSESVRSGVLQYLLPPPEAEAFAIRAAVELLGVAADAPFEQLADAYDERQKAGRAPVRLIRPVLNALEYTPPREPPIEPPRLAPFESAFGLLASFPSAVPHVCRVLRKTMEISRAGVQIATVARGIEGMSPTSGPNLATNDDAVDGALEQLAGGDLASVPIRRLLQALDAPEAQSAYRTLLARLYLPLPGLAPFFENLFTVYGELHNQLGIVLILDQFEEIFTRFSGHGTARRRSLLAGPYQARREATPKLPAYLRDQFFADCGALYRSISRRSDQPMRFVFSLREEYVSRLAPILRRAVPDTDRSIYRLALLSEEQAHDAMTKPFRSRDFLVDAAVEDAVFARLADDDRQIQPGPLQIVCTWLWDHRARSVEVPERRQGDKTVLGTEALYTAGAKSIDDILEQFFMKFLTEAPAKLRQEAASVFADTTHAQLTRYARMTILDLLRPLITADQTRNIVDGAQLIEAPFRQTSIRRVILAHLEASRILRREPRHDGEFYEITHEFLIAPALNALADDTDLSRLTRALQALEYTAIGQERELPEQDFATIIEFQDLLDVPAPFDEVVFRSAVTLGAATATLKRWYDLCSRKIACQTDPEQIDVNAKWPLTRPEMLVLEQSLRGMDGPSRAVQEQRLASYLLKSWLANGEPADRPMLQRAAHRWITDGRSSLTV